MALVTCPCAFLLHRLAQSVFPGLGIGFPSLCSHMCAFHCVFSSVCFHMCALICVLSPVCFHMRALLCVLSYVCSPMCSHMCAPLMLSYMCSHMCALLCVLSSVCSPLCSQVCSDTAVSLSQFYPQHCLGSLSGIKGFIKPWNLCFLGLNMVKPLIFSGWWFQHL